MKSSVILVVLAIGQSFVLFTKNIDVSVGSSMGLSATVCGMMLTNGYSAFLSIFVAIILGAIIGFVNGIGVAKFRVPAIIMTLGMLGIIRGTMLIFTGGKWIEDIPNDFSGTIYHHSWFTYNCMVRSYYFTTTILLLRKVPLGRYFYAVGDNEDGARLIGIPVNKSEDICVYDFRHKRRDR